MFGLFKKVAGAAAREVTADYSGNKDFLEAVCAVAALVASADGELEDSEKSKVIKLITNHSKLGKMYDRNTIEATVDTMFGKAKDSSGRNALAREIKEVKDKPDSKQMCEDIYLTGVDVANADGEMEEGEVKMLEKIADLLGVKASDFAF